MKCIKYGNMLFSLRWEIFSLLQLEYRGPHLVGCPITLLCILVSILHMWKLKTEKRDPKEWQELTKECAVPLVRDVFGRRPVWISLEHWLSRVRVSWLFSNSRSFGTNMPWVDQSLFLPNDYTRSELLSQTHWPNSDTNSYWFRHTDRIVT